MVEISVIIPVYNTEKYLRECLDSIINQTFKDIEIICIDDGSTDNSTDILKDYLKNDSRIKIITQENKGAGASRNIGISNAQGKYIYFMDSDDYLELNALEEVYYIALDKSADFVMFKIKNFKENDGKIIDDDYYNMSDLKNITGGNTFSYYDVSDIALNLCVCPPGNLFKRDLIKDIEFPEGLNFEDNVFFTHALFKAETIYFYDKFLYNRRLKDSNMSVKYIDTIEITNLLLDLCYEYNHPKHKKELYYRIFHNIYYFFKNADESQKDMIFKKIKEEYGKNKDKWENDDYFKNNLNPKYKHIFNCALKSRNAKKFENCVDSYSKECRLKKLMKKLRN